VEGRRLPFLKPTPALADHHPPPPYPARKKDPPSDPVGPRLFCAVPREPRMYGLSASPRASRRVPILPDRDICP
jgi:hypothetical protein